MKQTNKHYFALIAVAFVTFFSSCNKQTDIEPQFEKYLSFASVEEYNTTLSKVLEMPEEERLAWEKQQGFTSFVTVSNEMYETVAEKGLTLEQLQQKIEPLSEYLMLEQEESGDYVLLHALESTPKRFLCNVNRIFKIENTLYKVFEDNIVMCNEKQYKTLLSLNETNYSAVIDDDFQLMFTESELKDDQYNVTLNGMTMVTPINSYRYLLERRNDNGSNRTRIRVGFDVTRIQDNKYNYRLTGPLWGEAKPYKRVLGIWYETNRTINCEFKIIIDEYNTTNQEWIRKPYYYRPNSQNTKTIYYTFDNFTVHYYTSIPNQEPTFSTFFYRRHIGALDCRARTPDTDFAELSYNNQLINF
ncbi:MAG: hypothetical protein M0R02_01075 [Bacteroidales bacterium]|nr:hypothetical protein [Bacteroidales bacterium]NLK81113.1 hypothetical protein [Bacteroidales bacterium]